MAHSVAETDGPVKRRSAPRHRALRVTLTLYLLGVLRITQWPSLADASALDRLDRVLAWWHAHGLPAAIDVGVLEPTANVLMFVPFGLLVPPAVGWHGGRSWFAVPLGAAFSAALELSQLAFFPQRVSSVIDVGTNTAGAAVGVGVLLVLSTTLSRVSTPEDERTGDGPPPAPGGFAGLLEPSTLAPVELDLRRVFWIGIALWGVALLVAAVLTATGRTEPRLLWICLTGIALGPVGLLWERRRRAHHGASLG